MFDSVFVGGTFDQFHNGHKYLLQRVFAEGRRITIGLTTDIYVEKYKKGPHKTFGERKQVLENWLSQNNFSTRTSIIPIDDPYEPAVSSALYQALVLTEENKNTGLKINTKRKSLGLPEVKLIVVPLLYGEDGLPISSTRIRVGVIDTAGHLTMPDFLRSTLSVPLGVLHKNSEFIKVIDKNRSNHIVTVGDVTTLKVLENGLVPDLAIIDLQVKRLKKYSLSDFKFPDGAVIRKFQSGPGFISGAAFDALKNWSAPSVREKHRPHVFVVTGEEDLLVLPVIMFADLNTVVLYGQPDIPKLTETPGMVEIVVTDEKKKQAENLLKQFTTENGVA